MAHCAGLSRKSAAAVTLIAIITLFGSASPASAATYYLSPTGSSGNTGTQTEPWSLSHANAALVAGDTAILLDGQYSTAIAPARSGTAGNEITYRAANSRMAELIASNPRILVENRHYITIDGIKAHNGRRYAIGIGASHITINDCDFRHFNNGSFESGRFQETGGYITVTNSHIEDGADALHIREGRGHYVAGNTFIKDNHTLLILMGVTNSVVENNSLSNAAQKCMEVFSLRRSMPPNEVISEYNLIQSNLFYSGNNSCIQYGGNSSILRRNVYDSSSVGMRFASYGGTDPGDDPEAWFNAHNRFYNNTMYKCSTGIAFATLNRILPPANPGTYEDNICLNNIITGGTNTSQISIGWDAVATQMKCINNNMRYTKPGQKVFHWTDAYLESPPLPVQMTIAEIEAARPDNYSGNTEYQAKLVDPASDNFNLERTSQCIDAAAPLTQTTSSGNGTVVTVVDALFFTDGYGVIAGDMIRVEDQLAQIVSVNYATNELTVGRSLHWGPDAPVFTDYKGIAPDLGAFEADATPAVAGEHIFYNNSAWDGNDAAANAADDAAIADNKHALRPDDTATFSNYTSYSKGINGIMVDIMASAEPVGLEDFSFKVGNDSNPGSWLPGPEPVSISIREGVGISGSDRVTILWADNAIQNQWLQVTVLVSPQSGLDEPYIFSFGNAIGETGDSATDAQVTPADELEVRGNATALTVSPASIQRATDFNRDKKVGPTDAVITRNNSTDPNTALALVTAPSVAINQAPIANAGNDSSGVTFGDVTLSGSVIDDGYPIPPGEITTTWWADSTPIGATVIINDPSALQTTATFSAVGTYVMRMDATDGDLSHTDTMTVVIEEPVSGVFFEDDFDDGVLDGWTMLGNSDFQIFPLGGEPGFEVRAAIANSRMRANLDTTALSDTVYMSCQIRHTGALGGGVNWKGGWLFFVDDSGEGFAAYFGLEQFGNGGLSIYTTTDDAETSTYTLDSLAAPGPAAGWAYKNIQLVYNRTTDQLDYYYEGTLKGSVTLDPKYRDFTRVLVQLRNEYDGLPGQIDIDNIRIADTPTWPIAMPLN